MPASGGSDHRIARWFAETAIAAAGIGLIAAAICADAQWRARHFLPEFHPQAHLGEIANVLRVVLTAAGFALLLILRPRLGRVIASGQGRALAAAAARISLAVLLALAVCEALLRLQPFRARHEIIASEEPLRQRDARLGWTLVAAHRGRDEREGRSIDYISDAAGLRVRSADAVIDPDRPSLLFAGESFMYGYGLPWDESLPAQMESLGGLQSVNLAVNGYSSDQAYLRLTEQLPRFRQPVAIVSLFMPCLLVRNLQTDRPHLDAGLRWWPAQPPWRLVALAQRLLRYHGDAAIEDGIAMTRAVLRATQTLAQSRQARSLVLVPQFGAETAAERQLRQRILDAAAITYVQVALDPAWRIAHDLHPDARATRAMAQTVAMRLNRP